MTDIIHRPLKELKDTAKKTGYDLAKKAFRYATIFEIQDEIGRFANVFKPIYSTSHLVSNTKLVSGGFEIGKFGPFPACCTTQVDDNGPLCPPSIHRTYFLPAFFKKKILNFIKSQEEKLNNGCFLYNINRGSFDYRDAKGIHNLFGNSHLDLLQDMRSFLMPETKEMYKKLGIPYKRTYLLYGPPGNGKTSSILETIVEVCKKVEAQKILSWLCIQEEDFSYRLNNLTGMFCLIEDIDRAFEKDDKGKLVIGEHNVSRLMNYLDGFECLDGRILFVTANDKEVFEKEAIGRKGRIDKEIFFPNPTTEQRDALIKYYLEDEMNILEWFSMNQELLGKETPSYADFQSSLVEYKLGKVYTK